MDNRMDINLFECKAFKLKYIIWDTFYSKRIFKKLL